MEFITSEDVFNWLEKNYSNKKDTTYKTNLEILRSFFKFCILKGYIKSLPIKTWWGPRLHRKQPNYLTSKEQQKLRLEIEILSLRDRLIILMLLETGIRRRELCNLNISDLDFVNRTILVIGKISKLRKVYMPYELSLLLEKYLSGRNDKCSAVFLSKEGRRISHSTVYRLLRKVGESTLTKGYLGCHRLRYSYATNRLSRGDDLLEIKCDLGHEYWQVTERYATLSDEKFISDYNKYME